MFFTYQQNNSGGYYEIDDTVAQVVIIEADSPEEANERASDIGIFSYWSCECCGERFSSKSDLASGCESVEEAFKEADWMRDDKQVRIYYKDGTVSKEVQS